MNSKPSVPPASFRSLPLLADTLSYLNLGSPRRLVCAAASLMCAAASHVAVDHRLGRSEARLHLSRRSLHEPHALSPALGRLTASLEPMPGILLLVRTELCGLSLSSETLITGIGAIRPGHILGWVWVQ